MTRLATIPPLCALLACCSFSFDRAAGDGQPADGRPADERRETADPRDGRVRDVVPLADGRAFEPCGTAGSPAWSDGDKTIALCAMARPLDQCTAETAGCENPAWRVCTPTEYLDRAAGATGSPAEERAWLAGCVLREGDLGPASTLSALEGACRCGGVPRKNPVTVAYPCGTDNTSPPFVTFEPNMGLASASDCHALATRSGPSGYWIPVKAAEPLEHVFCCR